ncbi:hypothetical protein Nepgr_032735 [Nepenthes gracilis]|uniref:BHLH domain-containing protein n=1 Tax=Nepenthes gracilis TaxID=150966 RepID=A0AAD3TK10_NEPGR|nr:hypothetical protein Nepgr_032735 [Nepenthes gracilis]
MFDDLFVNLDKQPFHLEDLPDDVSLPAQNLPPSQEFNSCHCLKRYKCSQIDNQANYNQFDFALLDFLGLDNYYNNRQMLAFDPYTGVQLPVYGNSNCNNTVAVDSSDWRKQESTGCSSGGNRGEGGGSPSTQSLAARQRRRKISEKTQQLAKLIPGAQKLNTADMFQAAFKYIKFLQAQLTVLQSMNSIQNDEQGAGIEREELQLMLSSPSVQEKLYLEEKCLVSKEIAKELPSTHWLITSNGS